MLSCREENVHFQSHQMKTLKLSLHYTLKSEFSELYIHLMQSVILRSKGRLSARSPLQWAETWLFRIRCIQLISVQLSLSFFAASLRASASLKYVFFSSPMLLSNL